MNSVAVLDKPPVSLTLTTNMFVFASEFAGVPDSAPLAATFNQAGPLTFAKVSATLLRSLALVAMFPEYVCPAFAWVRTKELATKVGCQVGTTLMAVTITFALFGSRTLWTVLAGFSAKL